MHALGHLHIYIAPMVWGKDGVRARFCLSVAMIDILTSSLGKANPISTRCTEYGTPRKSQTVRPIKARLGQPTVLVMCCLFLLL